jgi:hypothetical protein
MLHLAVFCFVLKIPYFFWWRVDVLLYSLDWNDESLSVIFFCSYMFWLHLLCYYQGLRLHATRIYPFIPPFASQEKSRASMNRNLFSLYETDQISSSARVMEGFEPKIRAVTLSIGDIKTKRLFPNYINPKQVRRLSWYYCDEEMLPRQSKRCSISSCPAVSAQPSPPFQNVAPPSSRVVSGWTGAPPKRSGGLLRDGSLQSFFLNFAPFDSYFFLYVVPEKFCAYFFEKTINGKNLKKSPKIRHH